MVATTNTRGISPRDLRGPKFHIQACPNSFVDCEDFLTEQFLGLEIRHSQDNLTPCVTVMVYKVTGNFAVPCPNFDMAKIVQNSFIGLHALTHSMQIAFLHKSINILCSWIYT